MYTSKHYLQKAHVLKRMHGCIKTVHVHVRRIPLYKGLNTRTIVFVLSAQHDSEKSESLRSGYLYRWFTVYTRDA